MLLKQITFLLNLYGILDFMLKNFNIILILKLKVIFKVCGNNMTMVDLCNILKLYLIQVTENLCTFFYFKSL